MITVKNLREQLEQLEAVGMGDSIIWFRDQNSTDELLSFGILDNDDKNVAIG